MASINKVILVGNLGKDPETRTFPNGGQICSVSIATTDRWKDKQSGELREATEWHRVTFNNRLAEVAAQYLRKGSQVYVEGSLHTRKWSDKDGVEKYATEVRADQMQMLGGRPGGQDGRETSGSGGHERAAGPGFAPCSAPGSAPASAPGYAPGSAPARRASAPASRKVPTAATPGASTGFDDMDDDIPFVTASPRYDMQPSKVRRLQRTDF